MNQNQAVETRRPDKKVIREMNEFLVERIETFFDYIEIVQNQEKEISLIFLERFSEIRVDIIEKNKVGELIRWKRYSDLYLSNECMSWIGLSMKCISEMLKGKYKITPLERTKKSMPQAWRITKI